MPKTDAMQRKSCPRSSLVAAIVNSRGPATTILKKIVCVARARFAILLEIVSAKGPRDNDTKNDTMCVKGAFLRYYEK